MHAINLTIDSEKIYYIDVDSAKLYCYDNGEVIPITEKCVYRYEVMGNIIYYTDYLTHQMYRVNLNSVSEVDLISKHPVIRLLKYDDDVYYMNRVAGVNCINRISNNNTNQLIHIINNSIGFYFFMDDNKMYYGYDCSIDGGTYISVVDKDIATISDMIDYSNDRFQIFIQDWNGYEFHSKSLTIYDKKSGEIITTLTDIYQNGGTVIDNYYYISTVHMNYELYRFNLKTGNIQKLISIPHEDKGLQFEEKHSYQVNNNKVNFTYNDEEIIIDLTPFD